MLLHFSISCQYFPRRYHRYNLDGRLSVYICMAQVLQVIHQRTHRIQKHTRVPYLALCPISTSLSGAKKQKEANTQHSLTLTHISSAHAHAHAHTHISTSSVRPLVTPVLLYLFSGEILSLIYLKCSHWYSENTKKKRSVAIAIHLVFFICSNISFLSFSLFQKTKGLCPVEMKTLSTGSLLAIYFLMILGIYTAIYVAISTCYSYR